MDSQQLYVGIGGLVLGAFVGMNVGGGDAERRDRELLQNVEAQVAETQGQMASLSAQLEALQASVASGDAASAALGEQLDGAVASLSGQMEAMSSDVAERIAKAADAQSADMDQKLARLSGALEEIASASVPTAADVAASSSEPTQQSPAAVIDGFKVGETASLLDGKARVFVSSVDDASRTVRVAVNGQNLAMLGGAQPVMFSVTDKECTLSLDDLVAGHARMSASCVDATAEPQTAAAVQPAASDAAIAAASEPKSPGQTAWLLGGKARVFVSGVDAEARTARVAVNGLNTAIVGGPQAVTFAADGADCTLQIADFVGGGVVLGATCE